MPSCLRWVALPLLIGCGGASPGTVRPASFALPESTVVLDGTTGAPVAPPELLRRLAAADLVLLGELHDNPIHHALRGELITALASRHPAIVFEQFAESGQPILPASGGEDREGWLDRHGFDRTNWKWPLHRPVVEAAIAHGRSLWGSGLSREALRAVVRDGASAAPDHLRGLLAQSPLDSASRATVDRALVEGHCGKLPSSLIGGMRAAQESRDAAMTRALLLSSATGPAWLIAGNGHVRRDVGVPRLLRAAAPGGSVLAVGLLEREADGAVPGSESRATFDLVIVTPRAVRKVPCAGL